MMCACTDLSDSCATEMVYYISLGFAYEINLKNSFLSFIILSLVCFQC